MLTPLMTVNHTRFYQYAICEAMHMAGIRFVAVISYNATPRFSQLYADKPLASQRRLAVNARSFLFGLGIWHYPVDGLLVTALEFLCLLSISILALE